MGAMLPVPPEAAPWSVEVRPESSRLYAAGLPDGFPAVRSTVDGDVVSATLPRFALVPLGVACSVLLAHPLLARLQRSGHAWRSLSAGRSHVVLNGSGLVHFAEPGVEVAGMACALEVRHEHLAALRDAALERGPVAGGGAPSSR